MVSEPGTCGIEKEHIHALAENNDRLNGLPGTTWQQYRNSGRQVEPW